MSKTIAIMPPIMTTQIILTDAGDRLVGVAPAALIATSKASEGICVGLVVLVAFAKPVEGF
jgi:hypothetical protein